MTRHVRRRPLVLALTALLLVSGGGVAWGYWSSSATATGTATTATVTISQAGFGGTGATYRNDLLTSTGSFTVTNTGQTAGTASLTIAATSGAAMAAAMPISVWPVATAAACTAATAVPGGAITGTWASWQTSGVAIAPGAAVVLCVRTVVPNAQSLASPTGTQSTSSSLTVVFDDAAGWVGTVSSSDTSSRVTELIFPPVDPGTIVPAGLSGWFTARITSGGQAICLDVSGSGGVGTQVIPWTCHQDANQRWEIIAAPGFPGQVQLRPKNATGLPARLTVSGTGGLSIAVADNSAAQRWRIEQIAGGSYQLVTQTNGQCLTLATVSQDVQLITAPCGPATRGTQVVALTREPLSVTNGTTVQFGVVANPGATYALQRLGGTTWTTIATGTGTTLGATRSLANFPRNADTQYRIIVNGSTNVVYSGIVLRRDAGDTITAIGGVG